MQFHIYYVVTKFKEPKEQLFDVYISKSRNILYRKVYDKMLKFLTICYCQIMSSTHFSDIYRT